jgi:integrase
MPRLSRKPPKLSKHSSGQAFVRVDGANRYLGRWGSAEARAAYREFARQWKPAPPKQAAPAMDRVMVVEVLAAYVEHATKVYPPQTLAMYRVPVKLTREMFGDTPAKDFGPLKLEKVREAFVGRGMSRSVANRYTRLVVKMFRWAVSREMARPETLTRLATLEPLRRGQPGLRENPPVKPVDDATIEKTLPHLPSTVGAMVRLQRLTGARPGEITAMRPSDIDRAGDVWRYIPEHHKNEHRGHARTILLGPRAQEILKPFLARHALSYCFDPREAVAEMRETRRKGRKTPLGYGNGPGTNVKRKPAIVAGDRYTTTSYSKAVVRGAAKAGVASWSPNQLRHSLATDVRQRFGLEAAQVALGHARRTTTEIYAEPDLSRAETALRAIG